MTTYTRYFRWAIPDFNVGPWHAEWEALVRAMDRSLFDALVLQGMTTWANSTAYEIGNVVLDPDLGSLWVCEIAHTSAASPATFAQDRIANPTFWEPLVPLDEAEDVQATVTTLEAQTRSFSSQALNASRQAKAALSTVVASVSGMLSRVAGHESGARRYARQVSELHVQMLAIQALTASYMQAARNAQRRAESAQQQLADDQLVMKLQVFS